MNTSSNSGGALGIIANAINPQKPRPQQLGLASWLRPEVKGMYYSGKALTLDGYKFVGCRFDNCVLQVTSDNFEIIECVIDKTTRIEYSTNISKIIRLFLGRFDWATQYFPEFVPTKHANGSESITDYGG